MADAVVGTGSTSDVDVEDSVPEGTGNTPQLDMEQCNVPEGAEGGNEMSLISHDCDGVDGGCFGKMKKNRKDPPLHDKLVYYFRDALGTPHKGVQEGGRSSVDEFASSLSRHQDLKTGPDVDPPCLNDEYDMMKKKRGKAFIFVMTFDNTRKGAYCDADHYEAAFNHLGFDAERFIDASADDIWRVVHKYRQNREGDQEDHSCVVFAFSTHGYESDNPKTEVYLRDSDRDGRKVYNDVILARDKPINCKDMMSWLSDENCPSMAGKPKLFFFQACRGERSDEVMRMVGDDVEKVKSRFYPYGNPYFNIPLKRDFFIGYSAPPGYFSFRRGRPVGSWFVKELHDVILESGQELELLDIMVLVSNRVVKYKWNDEDKGSRIVPCFSSMLKKSVRFRKV